VADPDTILCPHCGAENPAEDAYCEKCHKLLAERPDDLGLTGAPKADVAPSAAPSRIEYQQTPDKVEVIDLKCKSCGAALQLAPGAKSAKCPYCGAEVILYTPPPPPAPIIVSEDDEEDEKEGVGFWGYRPRQMGPGGTIVGGVLAVIVGIVVAVVASSSDQSCSPGLGGQQQCTTVPVPGGVYLVAGLFILLGIVVVIYGIYRVMTYDSD
jgi:LSD1 subclass zinc finger protein